jgi:hypothetical protein
MNNLVKFNKALIAPCGMNCGTCMAYLRQKNRCPGCRVQDANKAVSVKRCIITNCINLEESESKFCYECGKFPCKRLKQLDKRYRTKYNTSFIENLLLIKEKGINEFLSFESKRRTCPNCGSTVCVHRSLCPSCKIDLVVKAF